MWHLLVYALPATISGVHAEPLHVHVQSASTQGVHGRHLCSWMPSQAGVHGYQAPAQVCMCLALQLWDSVLILQR